VILVDDRQGSKELVTPLRKAGLPAEHTRLDFGDVVFEGKGEKGKSVDIAVELKKLPELIMSIRDGRFSGHQLPGLLDTYDYSWLLVEGQWRNNAQGQMCSYKGRTLGWLPVRGGMSATEYIKHLLTYELCGGIHVYVTHDRQATIHFIVSLYRWWTDRALDKHTSHLVPHTAHHFLPVSPFRAAVQKFPGIGPHASLAVEQWFNGSLRDAVNAPLGEWAEIPVLSENRSKRLGMEVARKIVDFVTGEGDYQYGK